MKHNFKKWILVQWKNQQIRKSILITVIISIILPLLLPIISQILFGLNPTPRTVQWSLDYDARIPIFTEVSLAEISLLWIFLRFIPLIIFGYLNGIILAKIRIKNPLLENIYLAISSSLFYLLILTPMFKLFLFLNSIGFIRFIFDITDAFNF